MSLLLVRLFLFDHLLLGLGQPVVVRERAVDQVDARRVADPAGPGKLFLECTALVGQELAQVAVLRTTHPASSLLTDVLELVVNLQHPAGETARRGLLEELGTDLDRALRVLAAASVDVQAAGLRRVPDDTLDEARIPLEVGADDGPDERNCAVGLGLRGVLGRLDDSFRPRVKRRTLLLGGAASSR